MVILPKAINRFNTNPIKIPKQVFTDFGRTILKLNSNDNFWEK